MMFWGLIGVLLVATIVLILLPLVLKPSSRAGREEYDLTVFKDQLRELDRDLERGLIAKDEGEVARTEIERRMLTALENAKAAPAEEKGSQSATTVVAAISAAVAVVGSLILYSQIGSPTKPDVPYAMRTDLGKGGGGGQQSAHTQDSDQIQKMVESLENRLAENPQDVDGWMLLARSYRATGRLKETTDAFARAVEISGRNPDVVVEWAESLAHLSEGKINSFTRSLFEEALKQNPVQYKARFFVAYADAQEGQLEKAIQGWLDLLTIAPSDAPWIMQVQGNIDAAARELGVEVSSFEPSKEARMLAKQLGAFAPAPTAAATPAANQPKGPTEEDVKAASQMSEDDRTAMIRTMVGRLADRLEANPNDPEGWKRLINAYRVLGDNDKADEAQKKFDALSK